MFDLKKDISSWPSKFKKIIPPKDRFWADPHVMKRNGKYYVFIEEFMFYKQKGHISVIEIDQNGKYGQIKKVLEKDYHLSYPFVFESEEKIYMIPDSHKNRTIEIYESIDFPYKWEYKMNLMENIDTVDTTLLHHNNKWWLFTAISEYEGAERDELYIFSASCLLSTNWEAHPLNPVISDVKSARPAGKIFKRHGKIYRPSQDCSHHYGYGFKIQEITVLTETDYDEKTISSLEPNWEKEVVGTHSFAYEKGITVIDALMRRFKFF